MPIPELDPLKKLKLAEAQLLLDSPRLDLREKAIITLMLATGIRRGEITRLNIEDLDLDKRFLHVKNSTDSDVRLKRTKSGKERVVPFQKQHLKILENYLEWRKEQTDVPTKALFFNNLDKRFSPNGFGSLINDIGVKAGLKRKLTPHMTRHTYGTMMAKQVELLVLMRLMGHSSPSVTMIYYNDGPEEMRDVLDKIKGY